MELKELLLQTGMELFSRKAYHSTGIREITQKAGVPTGSFHYHFKNKEEFAVAMLDYYYNKQANSYAGLLFENELTAKEKLIKLFSSFIDVYIEESLEGDYKGCLIGNLGQDLSNESEAIASKAKELYGRLISGIASLLELGQSDESIRSTVSSKVLAGFIFDAYEGALIRRKIEKSDESITDFIKTLEQF